MHERGAEGECIKKLFVTEETWQNFVYNYSLTLIVWLNFSKQIAPLVTKA